MQFVLDWLREVCMRESDSERERSAVRESGTEALVLFLQLL